MLTTRRLVAVIAPFALAAGWTLAAITAPGVSGIGDAQYQPPAIAAPATEPEPADEPAVVVARPPKTSTAPVPLARPPTPSPSLPAPKPPTPTPTPEEPMTEQPEQPTDDTAERVAWKARDDEQRAACIAVGGTMAESTYPTHAACWNTPPPQPPGAA